MASLHTWIRRVDVCLPGGRARATQRLARRRARYANLEQFETKIEGRSLTFSTADEYSHSWFYTRYKPGDLHEAPVTRLLLGALDGASSFADVGSHLGWYACCAAAKLGVERVSAFEMDATNFELLERNLSLNGFDSMTRELAAIGDHAGTVEYMASPGHPSQLLSLENTRVEGLELVKTSVPMITLDEYFADRDQKPDVMKIDVEGAEMRVLRGADDLVHSHARVLFIEVHPGLMRAFGDSPHDLIRWLIERGFKLERIGAMRATDSGGSLTRVTPSSRLFGHSVMIRATKTHAP